MNAKLFWKRNASTVLTCIGGIGVIGTTVLAVKATPKALRSIEKAKEEKGEDLTRSEIIRVAGPKYIPTTIMGIGTITCIFGANILNKRSQASLISAYTLIDNAYNEYQNKVKELYGEETHNTIRDAIVAEKAEDTYVYSSSLCSTCDLSLDERCGKPVLFYEEYGDRYFEAPIEQVITAEYHFNRNFVLRGFTDLNELYEFLGLETTYYGSAVGWAVEDELYWIEFNHRKMTLDDGRECYILEMPWGPSAESLEYY